MNFWVFSGDLVLGAITVLSILHGFRDKMPEGLRGLPWHLGALLVLFIVIRFGEILYRSSHLSLRARKLEDRIRIFLGKIHTTLFGHYAGVRYTLFQPDELNAKWLVPVARFEYGQEHSRASESRARYRKGMGHTGVAWEKFPAPSGYDAFFEEFRHESGAKMVDDFSKLGIPKRIAKAISSYMVDAGGIYSIRLTSGGGLNDLGVLSIDLKKDVLGTLAANGELPTLEEVQRVLPELVAYLAQLREA